MTTLSSDQASLLESSLRRSTQCEAHLAALNGLRAISFALVIRLVAQMLMAAILLVTSDTSRRRWNNHVGGAMTDATALLQQLGFSEYEARAYLALLQRNPANGYELAKTSGIPRANIYMVLQKLEERGAAVRIETPDGSRYAPVAPSELTERLASRFQNVLGAAQQALEELAAPADPEYVWNIRGYAALLDHAHALLSATQKWLLVAIGREEAGALAQPVAQAATRGVEVVTLCLDECPQECGSCRGTICRYCATLVTDQRFVVLVADDAEMLAGEIGPSGEVLAVRTRQRLQVDLASWYIRHSLALTAVLDELNSRENRVLKPENQALLQSVQAGERQGDWLDQMRALLHRGRAQ
jgi:HTH-type transcriptional regulator, sugar sensing transcriptional regulator